MAKTPERIAAFLRERRIAVAGVSRTGDSAGNPVFKKLRACGYEVFPVNPNASEVEGVTCYPDLASIPGGVSAVVVATPPAAAAAIVQRAIALGVRAVWLHRAFGQGSVSGDAVELCRKSGINCIAGGCPLMYCQPVDFPHRCLRVVLGWGGRLPI